MDVVGRWEHGKKQNVDVSFGAWLFEAHILRQYTFHGALGLLVAVDKKALLWSFAIAEKGNLVVVVVLGC